MTLFKRSAKKPRVRAHHMSDETVNAQGVGGSAAKAAGCGNVSTMITLGKALLIVSKPLCSSSDGSEKKKKAPKDPNMTLSLFCGVSRSNGATDGKAPPTRPKTPPKEKEGSSFWPFAESAAKPEPSVTTPPPKAEAKVPLKSAMKPQANSIGLVTKPAPIKPTSTRAPKLREVPELVIQPYWRHMDPADDLDVEDLLHVDSDEHKSEEQSVGEHSSTELPSPAPSDQPDGTDEPSEVKQTKKLSSKQRKALKKKEKNAAKKQKFTPPEFIKV